MSKQVIILMGPPGAGKGTQGELLAEKLGLYYLETSKILEESFVSSVKEEFVEVEGKKYFFKKEKELWEKGILCSPPFVRYLLEQKINELFDQEQGLLLAGSPRTLYEAKTLMPFLENLYGKENIKIILMDVSTQESIFRNSHRRICELMRHPILYTEETKNLKFCPFDGSKLLKRKGLDDEATIKVRLKEFQERTMPIIDYLEKQGFEIKKVDGSGSVAEVFTRNLKMLSVEV